MAQPSLGKGAVPRAEILPPMATGGEKERNILTIIWRIDNILHFKSEYHGNGIRSSCFYPCALGSRSSYLWLELAGERVSIGSANLSLCTQSSLAVDCEFSIIADNGQTVKIIEAIREAISRRPEYELLSCLTIEELFAAKETSFLLHDTLNLRCRVWMLEGNFPNSEYISVCSRIELAEGSISRPLRDRLISRRDTFNINLKSIHEHLNFTVDCYTVGDWLRITELCIELNAHKMQRRYVVKLEVFMLDDGREVMKVGENEKFFPASNKMQTWTLPSLSLIENLRERMLLPDGNGLGLLFYLTAFCRDITVFIEKAYYAFPYLEEKRTRAALTPNVGEEKCEVTSS